MRRSLPPAALAVVLVSASATARPVITEVAWSGDPTSNSGTDEWIEIYNPDAAAICDLSQLVVLGGGTSGAALSLPAVALASNDFFLVQNTANVPPTDAAHASVSSSIALTDGGEALCLCPAGTSACDATCDVVNPTGGAWFAGSSTSGARRTMERLDPTSDGSLDASWADGAPASPLAGPFGGTPGNLDACSPVDAGPPPVDGGPPVDAGPPPADAGPNDEPSVAVSEPASTVRGATVDVVYSASDDDPGDAVTVDLYWSGDTTGADGVRFARGLPGGAGRSATLDTGTLPVGTWRIFARARDARGASAVAYAPGAVEVGEGGLVEPVFELVEPDGVDDAQPDGTFAIQWRVELPTQATGSVSLFVDDDDEGADGDPLMGGLSAAPEGPRAFLWDPVLTETPPGVAHLYAVLDWSDGRVIAYAPAPVTVGADTCACHHAAPNPARRLLAGLTLAILLLPFHRRGGHRRGATQRRG
ncbi:MAG: hypothetical protein HYS27_16365 [Deltaproteobacteria bacterium]|nr:hypothetical protein [Deltaproteobacteria bacterium]